MSTRPIVFVALLGLLVILSASSDVLAGKVCEGSSVELVTRAEWGARAPKKRQGVIRGAVNMAFIHHTEGTTCNTKEACIRQLRIVQNFHMNTRGWDDIGYSFLIGEDGRVYEGRGWGVVGAHTRNYNNVAYGFSMIGNFMSRLPNQQALTAVKAIIQCGVNMGKIRANYEMFGHRDAGCTSCPGNALYPHIKTWPRFSSRKIKKHC